MHLATSCYQLSYFDSQVQMVSYPADRCLGRRTGVGQMAGLARSSRPLV